MKRSIWTIVVVIIIASFALAAYYSGKKADTIQYSTERQKALDEIVARPKITINTKYQYRDGNHVFFGYVEVPTPCYTHNVVVQEVDGVTELAITYTDTAEEDQVCAQVITEKTFKVTFAGSPDDTIIATLNGEVVNLNVFEVPLDEDIEEAELFIKG